MGSPFITTCFAAAAFAVGTFTATAWSPGVGNESATSGFTVDTQVRNDVISFWHSVYMESEGYENRINWTGTVSSNSPGTTSAAFKDDVLRRINYFRAMAGMSANITLTSSATVELGGSTPSNAQPSASTTKEEAAQASARMLSRNSDEFIAGGGVATGAHDPHNPPNGWSKDNSTARNGAFHSTLAIGLYGPGAIDGYMDEDDQGAAGGENSDVGHRRYLLYSRAQEFATGDVPPTGEDYFAANTLYVSGNLLPSPTSGQFVPWPNAGFFPEPLVPERWSLTYRGADFSSAIVTMTDADSNNVPVTVVSRTASFADNTIAWKPNAASIASAENDDQPYNVTISNINVGGTLVSHSYQVIIINPNRLLESTDVSGSASPPDSGANYYFNPVVQAEEYQLDVSTLTTATWSEGAEDGTDGNIVDDTDVSYDLRSSTVSPQNGQQFWDTGSKAFRLAFPRNEFGAFQSFEINRTLIPQTGASITFRLCRGLMTSNTKLVLQSSTNGGASWSDLETYSGKSNGFPDSSFSTETVSLTSTGQDTLIRFIIHQPANTGVYSIEGFPNDPVGAFIDGITPVNCDGLDSLAPSSIAASADFVTLDSTTGGGPLNVGQEYTLRVRARVGNHWFSYGSSLAVTPVAAASLSDYELWFRGQYAIVGSFTDDFDQDGVPNAVERIFGLNPVDTTDGASALTPQISGSNIQISHAIIPGETIQAECSSTLLDGSWSPVTVTISGGVATASVPISGGACFIRWKAAP